MNEHRNDPDQEQVTEQELRQLAYQMALALPTLDCPDCCGAVHPFIEHGCGVYREEWEWACFVQVLHYSRARGHGV